jgi:hypothetical protein
LGKINNKNAGEQPNRSKSGVITSLLSSKILREKFYVSFRSDLKKNADAFKAKPHQQRLLCRQIECDTFLNLPLKFEISTKKSVIT